jgi:hypothetical protein
MGSAPLRVIALVAMILLAGATFCLFDDDHATRLDPCSLLLLPVAGLVLGAPSLLAGRMMPVLVNTAPAALVEPSFPPPRS